MKIFLQLDDAHSVSVDFRLADQALATAPRGGRPCCIRQRVRAVQAGAISAAVLAARFGRDARPFTDAMRCLEQRLEAAGAA